MASPLVDLMAPPPPPVSSSLSSLELGQPQKDMYNRLVVTEKTAVEDLLVQLNVASFYD